MDLDFQYNYFVVDKNDTSILIDKMTFKEIYLRLFRVGQVDF